jgi:DNA-binding CsgD family transcriptional regulator
MKTEHTAMDALALSCKRLKAKGLTVAEIADRHNVTIQEVLALLTRKV